MISLDDVAEAWAEVQVEMQDDPALVPHLYADKKWSVLRISRHTGLHRTTIYRRLEAAGIHQTKSQPGAPRKERCIRDHSLAEHGVPRKGGGRECRKCKQDRERKPKT